MLVQSVITVSIHDIHGTVYPTIVRDHDAGWKIAVKEQEGSNPSLEVKFYIYLQRLGIGKMFLLLGPSYIST